MARGTLRIFLGSAPGVGKTYAMLREGHRLREGGEDVVVAFARDRGRRDIRALLAGLELIPAQRVPYQGLHLEELDLDAVIRRGPATAIVDDYAHANPPGSPNAHRWQDVDELLDAGINVLSTLDIQHLASLSDVVSTITDVRPAESVPDEIARRAGQIQLVDISPELLRQRLADGKIVAADRVDAALANFYRPGNLAALRELALLWLADRVDEGLAKYRTGNGIETSWPARERIVVGLPGGPEGEILIRRGARILNRVNGGDLLAVHVRAAETAAAESPQELESQRRLVQDLGGSYHLVAGEDPAAALLDFARSVNATQIVVGIPAAAAWPDCCRAVVEAAPAARVVRGAGAIDVHIVSGPPEGRSPGVPRRRDLGRARVTAGFVMAILLPGPAAAPAGGEPGPEPGHYGPGPAHRVRRRGTGRRPVARDPRGALEQPAGELLLHPAGGHTSPSAIPRTCSPSWCLSGCPRQSPPWWTSPHGVPRKRPLRGRRPPLSRISRAGRPVRRTRLWDCCSKPWTSSRSGARPF